MALTSFTLVAWAKANSMWNTTIRSPYGDDIQGNLTLSPGVWYHVRIRHQFGIETMKEKIFSSSDFRWHMYMIILH